MSAPAENPTSVVFVAEDGTEVIVGSVDASRPDLALVDALARLQLAARRRGWLMRLRGVTIELRGLLELVGLAEALGLEARGQPELREQLGIDEVMQSRYPPV